MYWLFPGCALLLPSSAYATCLTVPEPVRLDVQQNSSNYSSSDFYKIIRTADGLDRPRRDFKRATA